MKKTLLALTAAAALAVAGAGFAQPNGPGGPPRDGMHRPQFDPAKMAERRAQHLKDVLQLRPDQDGALRTFLDATRPPGDMRERFKERRQEGGRLTTPQRLDLARKAMSQRQARFEQIAGATLRFYNQLTPAQQKAFDAQRGGGMRGGHMRGPGGRGEHGGRGPGMGGPKA